MSETSNALLRAGLESKLQPGTQYSDQALTAFALGAEWGRELEIEPTWITPVVGPRVDLRAPWKVGSPAAQPPARTSVDLGDEQISALYLCLLHDRKRPAFGWMEEPLVEVEKILWPLHSDISDRSFDAMDRQFWGVNRFAGHQVVESNRQGPTTCGYCSYFEDDGELKEQCAKCRALDAAAGAAT